MKTYSYFLTLVISILSYAGISQNQTSTSVIPLVERRHDYKIDHQKLLLTAMSHGVNVKFNFELPTINGVKKYAASRNEVMDAEFRSSHPNLVTLDLFDTQNKLVGAATISALGLNGLLNLKNDFVAFNSKVTDPNTISYKDEIESEMAKSSPKCEHHPSLDRADFRPKFGNGNRMTNDFEIGKELLKYRVAIVCTGEFYVANGGTDGTALAAISNSINNINLFYRNDMSLILELSQSRIKLYNDANTDPFIPDNLPNALSRTNQASTVVNMNFASNNYDVGQVFHTHKSGDNWSGGGVAYFETVCDNGSFGVEVPVAKAGGWSGSFSNNGFGWFQLAAHEFGHQFGASHTFNGTGGSCTAAISEISGFEIGSGTSIMSYDGTCDASQNIPSNEALDGYFHTFSIQQMTKYIVTGGGGACATKSLTNNAIPQVDANPCGSTLEIPKGTPFYLKGKATDENVNDVLTYSWEQMDEDGPDTPTQGLIGPAAGAQLNSPLFRSFPPSLSPERYFPKLANPNLTFEVLPIIARNIKMALTVRDNNVTSSANAVDNITIKVNASGPFQITRPKGGETLTAGMAETISWNTNGSGGLCSNLRMKLSTDGGLTYPIVLAQNIPYAAGTFTYNVPSNIFGTTTARIMMECMDKDCAFFFELSDNNFTIISNCAQSPSVICPKSQVTADQGAPNLNMNVVKIVGPNVEGLGKSVNFSDPKIKIATSGVDGIGCAEVSNNFYKRTTIYVTESGDYTFSTANSNDDDLSVVSLFRSNFVATNPCGSFVASTGEKAASGGAFLRSDFTATLTACTEYVLVFYLWDQPAVISVIDVTGPGIILEKSTPPANTVNEFVIVNEDDGTIAYIGQNTDLTTLPGGNYRIYSAVIVDATPVELAAFVGGPFVALTGSKCITLSGNSRPVKINSSCIVSAVTAGAQGLCEAGTNFYTQDLIVSYDKPPTTGKLRVNGQDFDISTSPQTVKLIDLDSDGLSKSVTAEFTAQPACKKTINNLFTSPTNCCPAIVELGIDKNGCAGDNVELDAGTTGQSHLWFKDGVLISGQTTSKLTVSSNGKYEVEVIHSSGCKRRDNVTITFTAKPIATLASSITLCESTTLTLQPVIVGGATYKWLRGNTDIPGAITTTLDITQAGSYTVIATSSNGCTGSATTTVSQIAKPTLELGPAIQKCQSDVAVLDAGAGASKYQWYKDGVLISGATMRTFSPIQSGIYRAVIENASMCIANDEVSVMFFAAPTVQPLPLTFSPCQGTPFSLITTANDFQSLQWFYNNAPIAASNTLTIPVTNSGLYTLEAANNIGCKTRVETTVTFKSRPTVNLGANVVACAGNTVELNAGMDGTSYVWSQNGTLLSNNTSKLVVTQNGTYAVTVTNADGCTTIASKNVNFIPGPTLDLGVDKAICQGDTYTISAVTNATNPTVKWLKNGSVISGENGLSLTITEAGAYEASLTGGMPACEVTKIVTITVNPIPGINLGQDKILCDGDVLPTLDAGANHTSIAWTLNGTQVGTTRTIMADKTGTYKAVVRNSFNCSNSDEVKVTINPLPTLTLLPSYNLCDGQTLKVDATTNATKFVWKKGAAVITGQSNKTIDITTEGTYSCIASTAANCNAEFMFTVVKRVSPTVNLGVDDIICPGETLTLNAGTQTMYKWNDSSMASTLIIVAGTPAIGSTKTYFVEVTNQFDCTKVDSVKITINPVVKATIISDNPGVCNGEPVILTASGGNTYTWSGPPGTLSSTNTAQTTASPTETSSYTIEVGDSECPNNIESKSIDIKVFEPLNLTAGRDTIVVKGRSVKLSAKGGISYQWDNTSLINGPSNVFNPVVMPTEETIFSVTITDKNGCEYVDSLLVSIIDDPLSLFKAVNLITPNDDGSNDVLYFGGLDAFPKNTLRIYNRWGNVVYSKEGYQADDDRFDGNKNRERLPADTYYYVLIFADRTVKSSLSILWD